MILSRIMALLLSTTFYASPTRPQSVKAPTVDEVRSHDCARSVALMLKESAIGPLFFRENLVFTSTMTASQRSILLVSSEWGTFSVPLPRFGVNKIRFDLPSRDGQSENSFFLSYLHDEKAESRVFDLGHLRPPAGRDELEYHKVETHRADELLPHFEYAIYVTARRTVQAFASGRIKPVDVNLFSTDRCDHLERRAPQLAANIQRQIATLDLMVYGKRHRFKTKIANHTSAVSKRAPASVR